MQFLSGTRGLCLLSVIRVTALDVVKSRLIHIRTSHDCKIWILQKSKNFNVLSGELDFFSILVKIIRIQGATSCATSIF